MKTVPAWTVILIFISLGFVGCTGSGHTVNFNPHAIPSSSKPVPSQAEHLTIVVTPFQDHRSQKTRIGSRTHFWGGATHFNVWNGKLGEGMADLAVEYLQQRNWQAQKNDSMTDGETPPADVVLTGDILTFSAHAKSGFGFTSIDVHIQVGFEAKNTVDGSTIRMVLGANGSDTVATFDPKDVEELTNLVAKDLFNQLFRDLTVQDKAFHLKTHK